MNAEEPPRGMRRLRPPGAGPGKPVDPAPEATTGEDHGPSLPAALHIRRSTDTGEAPRPAQGPTSDGTKGIVGGRGTIPKLPPPKAPKPPSASGTP